MERVNPNDIAKRFYWEVGQACTGDEAIVDLRHSTVAATGCNNIFRAIVRSRLETKNGDTKVWHSLSLVDKKDPTEFYFCKINEDGDVLYSDSHEPLGLKEMAMEDSEDRNIIDSLLKQLEKVDWQPQEQSGGAESKMPRFNL